MTGKEFLKSKIKEKIEGFSNNEYTVDFNYYTPPYGRIHFSSIHKYYPYDYVNFDFIKGIDFEDYDNRLKNYPKSDRVVATTKNFCKRINEATAMLRFYYSKNFNIRDLREIFNLSKEEVPSGATAKPDISSITGHPEFVSGKGGVRIKIYDPTANKPWYSQKIYRTPVVGKLTKDKTRFTINTPTNTAVARGADITFLNVEDAEEFINNNPEIFSKFGKENISFSKTQTHDFQKIPVLGSDKAYVTTYYYKWRDREGKPMPIKD